MSIARILACSRGAKGLFKLRIALENLSAIQIIRLICELDMRIEQPQHGIRPAIRSLGDASITVPNVRAFIRWHPATIATNTLLPYRRTILISTVTSSFVGSYFIV